MAGPGPEPRPESAEKWAETLPRRCASPRAVPSPAAAAMALEKEEDEVAGLAKGLALQCWPYSVGVALFALG